MKYNYSQGNTVLFTHDRYFPVSELYGLFGMICAEGKCLTETLIGIVDKIETNCDGKRYIWINSSNREIILPDGTEKERYINEEFALPEDDSRLKKTLNCKLKEIFNLN